MRVSRRLGIVATMAKLKGRRGRNQPQDDYELEGDWWQPGDDKLGKPLVGGAIYRPTGIPVVVKQWVRRDRANDTVLREIWYDEIRQLNRLKGLPKASVYLATIRDSFFDDQAFTLILECGDRVPLARKIKHGTSQSWLGAPRGMQGRLRLWQEISRLAEALDILHGQGLLHRNIDASTVMTAAGPDPDFLLTGFEWSMRLTDNAPRRRGTQSPIQSFYEDWRAVGNLIGSILGLPSLSKPKERYRADPSANTDFLTAPERDLLRTLIAADPLKRLDAEVVTEQLDHIIATLEQARLGNQAKLVLALRLDAQSNLSRQIRDASQQKIRLDDYEAQRLYIQGALLDRPRLVQVRGYGANPTPSFRLTSSKITIDLRPFPMGRDGGTTWSLAEAKAILPQKPAQAEILGEVELDGWELDVLDRGDARRRAANLQGKTSRWNELIKAPPRDLITAALDNRSYAAAMLVQVTDMIWRAAHIWPVRRVSYDREGSTATLILEGREDSALDELSTALGLKPPAARLLSAMRDETIQVDGDWQLSPDLAVGRVRSQATSWRFAELKEDGATSRYVFESSGSNKDLLLETDLYLKLGGSGDDALLGRRLDTLRSLRDHTELLGMLGDPTGESRLSRDDQGPLEQVSEGMDTSKAAALRGAWSRLPLYLVQGPPGVGKTRLVRALVTSRLGEAPMDRLLLTAQSHSAVDHLLDEVKDAIEALPIEKRRQIFPLRCRAIDAETRTDWDREIQARTIVQDLAGSTLVKGTSSAIRQRVRKLAQVYGRDAPQDRPDSEDEDEAPQRRFERSFESLLRRSANLVFASTNSKDLARLLEEKGQFDWSMVEEAAKATGVELLAPLMLSHRRLLIGDHQQLPAFDAERLKALLSDSPGLKEALNKGRNIITPLFRKGEMEDALDRLIDEVDERLCAEAADMLVLFESLIVPNVIAQPDLDERRQIGRQLLEQHRMHPVIASLISDVFYNRNISTFHEAKARFQKPAPLRSVDPDRLPDVPLVFVDIPYVQETVGMKPPEREPRWSNPLEANLCVEILAQLRAEGPTKPSLAVLSPYRRQVRLLRQSIGNASTRLPHLDGFNDKTRDGWCGTVDSFQGNEADCVLVSLVRNNSMSGLRGLGFLSDERRMNVLLSRAKWRLIVVGSLRFLRKRLPQEGRLPPSDPLAFLERFLNWIDPVDGNAPEGVAIVPSDKMRQRAA